MKEPIQVLVVEDEVIVSQEITETLTQYGYEVVGQARNISEALSLVEKKPFDIALLDINLADNEDGVRLARLIRSSCDCVIIFLTALVDEATLERAKLVLPNAYLVKPFHANHLNATIQVAFEHHLHAKLEAPARQATEHIYLKSGARHYKVKIQDILFIQAEGSYCTVVTHNQQYTYSFNLKAATERLIHPSLIRAHRSFLVNLDNIDAVEGNELFLGTHVIQMSTTYREVILDSLNLL